ncbi:MAG: hypothetical protein IPO92_17690 [Saprospiraceae bacterium]|nr:hypothetical protein [Saprospiraceae bacterium]
MKYIFFLLVCITTDLPASEDVHLKFSQGNKALFSKDYAKALESYASIDQGKFAGKALFKNMALTYANMNQNALAILYYEKALKYAPNDQQLRSDLTIVRKRISEMDDAPQSFILISGWNYFTGVLNSNFWAILSLLCLSGIGIIFILNMPQKRWTKPTFYYITLLFCLFLITGFASFSRCRQMYHNNGIIITSTKVSLKTGPDMLSPDITTLPAGTKVFSEDAIENWVNVKTENGDSGWIMSSDGQKI